MAIESKTDTGNYLDWFNIPGLDGKAMGGAIGKSASISAGMGATYGGALGLIGWILSELFPKGGANKALPEVNTDKILPKDIAKYGSKVWPNEGKQVETLPLGDNTKIGNLQDLFSKWLRKDMAWPNEGQMVETLPLGDTGKLDVAAPTIRNYGTPEGMTQVETLPLGDSTKIGTLQNNYSKWLRKDMAWPNEGQMVETLPLGDTGKLDVAAPVIPGATTRPNYGTPEGMTQVETLPLGDSTKIGTLQNNYSKWLRKDMAWPNEGQMVETLPLDAPGKLDVAAPVIPGATTKPNYGTATWPNEGQMVETLPLDAPGKLDVAAPVIPGATTKPNYGTATWPNEGQMVETLPLGDTGKLDVAAPIIDVKPNADAEPWVSGATNATATWPNEGQMVESLPPFYNKDLNINWSGPMITDKTGENEETTINPVSFENMYELIKAEQQAQWAREDAIRKETQEREDNAWQRAVDDMFKAGVNPNLVNAGPAESGGGITNATGMNYTMWESELQKEVALLQQSIDQNFKGDENDKDRFTQILGNILSMFSVIAMFKGKI